MILYAITGILLLGVIAIVDFFLSIRNAPIGWEDNIGFHLCRVEENDASTRWLWSDNAGDTTTKCWLNPIT